jgi:hypothetical protein
LACNKGATPGAFNVREVNENIWLSIGARDKSVTLFIIEKFHGTGWHSFYFFLFICSALP